MNIGCFQHFGKGVIAVAVQKRKEKYHGSDNDGSGIYPQEIIGNILMTAKVK